MPPKPEQLSSATLSELRKQHDLRVHNFLGSGTYARVFKASKRSTNETLALKLIDKSRFLPREQSLVLLLNHPHIVKVEQIFDVSNYTCMVTELCENGDLLERIRIVRRIVECDAKFLFRQLVEALKYLEKMNIVHRDLKCENVLLDRFDNVKLADFGFARFLLNGQSSATFCGSKMYVAPEVLRAKSYKDNKIDIWSAGIVLYVMTTGVMPYDDRDMRKMIKRQMEHQIKFPRSVVLSHALKSLIYDILRPHPDERPTYKRILESEWLTNTPYELKSVDNCATANAITE